MKNLILTLFVCYGLSSCVVNSPSCHAITVSDSQNNIEIVNRPRIKTKVSHVGITFQIGATVGGALAGMSLQPTTFFDNKNQPATSQLLNGVIGAAVGYGITSIMYKLQGQGKTNYSPNFDNWLASYNRKKGTNYVSLGNGYDIIVNSPSNESNFKAKNISQSVGFKNAFPNSFRIAEVEKQGIANLNNLRDTEIFVREFPNSPNKAVVENKSISFVNSLATTREFFNSYPNSTYRINLEKQAYNWIVNRKDADYFLSIFPNGNYTTAVQQKIKQWEEEEKARIREAKEAQLRAVAEMWVGAGRIINKIAQALPKSSGTDNANSGSSSSDNDEAIYEVVYKNADTEVRVGSSQAATFGKDFKIQSEDGGSVCEWEISITNSKGEQIVKNETWSNAMGGTGVNKDDFPITVTLTYQTDCPQTQNTAEKDKVNGKSIIKLTTPRNYTIFVD